MPRITGARVLAAFSLLAAAPCLAQLSTLPVPVPPENPITEPKRVLGKILFFDEQLSADNTVACATCHQFNRGGSDGRRARNPGPDNILNSPDDVFASPGVIRSDQFDNYLRDLVFGAAPQITDRAANSPVNSAFAVDLFWDGRARSQFVDPQTSLVSIPVGGALESQTVNPPVSTVEMAHDNINWAEVTGKLLKARPLALATTHPADVAAALTGAPDYPELFRQAFGDTSITADRIAKAIATYERTLIANDTPWDRFMAGQPNAMTQGQIAGWNFFRNNNCITCHAAPLFTDNSFRNIGVRPVPEDNGRQAVTGLFADRGRFKVPGLRNVGLKNSFMHNGGLTTLTQVIQFYTQAPGSAPMFPENRDPLVPVPIPPNVAPALQDFLANALTDARVRDGVFPFDSPALYTTRPGDRPTLIGGGVAGTGGIFPQIIAVAPPMLGNEQFKIGLDRALGGAPARLLVSSSPPVGGRITPTLTLGSAVASGTGAGNGVATHHWPLSSPAGASAGQTLFAQWVVDDPAAPGGQAFSNVASIRFFCGSAGCPSACRADFTGDGSASVQDLFQFLAAYFGNDIRADMNASGSITVQDVFDFLSVYFAGC